jgi:hypothetical protein
LRPHLAGNEEGLNGENVVMTYCAMANLGIGYTPEIEGKKVDLGTNWGQTLIIDLNFRYFIRNSLSLSCMAMKTPTCRLTEEIVRPN